MTGFPGDGSQDVFDTAALRARVLDAWAASPARFREDANAEEDLALGAYRDRLVVELAQNAADAATRAGRTPGRLLLRLSSDALLAANTGEPLEAAGVEALSTLRASAKRDPDRDVVGRFGVGFAAVLAVTDEPEVHSKSGAVRWSAAQAHTLVTERARASAGLADELARRAGAAGELPVLRLPFPAEGQPPAGYDTAVVLPLRDPAALDTAQSALAGVDAALLLTLPALGEVVVELDLPGQRLRRVLRASRDGDSVELDEDGEVTRWRLSSASGSLDPALLADRPLEERRARSWTATCALPVDGAGRPLPLPPSLPAVVHAPTPTDESWGLPCLLVASFPLEPTRRHVARGPLADFVVARCADVYAGLVAALPSDPLVLGLIPAPLAAGELDGMLREAIRRRLADTPFLPGVSPGSRGQPALLRPREAVVLGVEAREAAAPERLATVLDGLVDPAWWRTPARMAGLTALGVRQTALADLVDQLMGLSLDPSEWHDLYAALSGANLDALGALPVPLADGRLVRGPRGLLLAHEYVSHLDALGLRVVHPAAAHPLLERLGAAQATPRTLLQDPVVRAAVASSYDVDDPEPVAEAVLGLVAAAGLAPGEEPWLADLALPADDGEWYPAGETLLPRGALAGVVAQDTPLRIVAVNVLERWGTDVLRAVGVLDSYALVRDHDVPLDIDACDHDLDGEDEWVGWARDRLPESEGPVVLVEFVAVRDLELTDPSRWDEALALLARPPLRDAITAPVRAVLADGRTARLRPYTAWWLGRQPVLGGRLPTDLHTGTDARLAGLYGEAPAALDPELARALGVRGELPRLLDEPGGPDDLLDRLAQESLPVGRAQLRALYAALAAVSPERVSPPERVRALLGGVVVVADASDVVAVDAPDLLPLVDGRPLVLVPAGDVGAIANLLDIAVASESVPGRVQSEGQTRPVPGDVAIVVPEAPRSYVLHDRLVVDGVEVPWRVAGGTVHAASAAGLARGMAWAGGAWERRHLVEAALQAPGLLEDLLAEADLDDTPTR